MSEWSQRLTRTQTWTEVPSSVSHFLQIGSMLRPTTYKYLLTVLCPVRSPITTMDCALLKDNNRALVARLGSEINFPACLCVLQGPQHNTKCWFSIQRLIVPLTFCLDTPRKFLVRLTSEQNRPLRACRRFHFLAPRHAQGPGKTPQCAG